MDMKVFLESVLMVEQEISFSLNNSTLSCIPWKMLNFFSFFRTFNGLSFHLFQGANYILTSTSTYTPTNLKHFKFNFSWKCSRHKSLKEKKTRTFSFFLQRMEIYWAKVVINYVLTTFSPERTPIRCLPMHISMETNTSSSSLCSPFSCRISHAHFLREETKIEKEQKPKRKSY